MIRALSDVAHLRLDAVRAVLAAVEDEALSWHAAVGAVHSRLSPLTANASASSRGQVDALLDPHCWAATDIAEAEVVAVESEDHTGAAEHIVVGTLLLEPVLLTLRRIAQENVSQKARD